jgi:hypothetical protein
MPTRKIDERFTLGADARVTCRDPDHQPPDMLAYEPGTYEHVCARCGMARVFTVGGRK